MPRKIRYTKAMGTTLPGHIEERSDIDANILVTLGVAEEITGGAAAADVVVAEDKVVDLRPAASRAERRRLMAATKGKRAKKSGKEGYNRRDMTAEDRT